MGDTDKPLSSDQGDSFADELEEYDLLRPKPTADEFAQTDLTRTAKAFNTRIQRKKKEQEVESEQAEKAARNRHLIMLRSLMNIRKSLRELTRVDLGERFKLTLSADDWAGWPRLTIHLHVQDAVEREYVPLIVTAHDRYEAGTIEISYSGQLPVERISVVREADLKRLPNLLRKCVRTYLDYVGEIVLSMEHKGDSAISSRDRELESKQINEFQEASDAAQQPMLSGDLFTEAFENDFLETLPTMEHIDSLPGVEKK